MEKAATHVLCSEPKILSRHETGQENVDTVTHAKGHGYHTVGSGLAVENAA
jgi:hypothetical protein